MTIMPDLSRAKHGEAVVPDYHRFRVDLAKEMGKERYKSLSEGDLDMVVIWRRSELLVI